MSFKITGLKKLDANVYDRIIIREVDGNYCVNIIGDRLSYGYVAGDYKLSDSFKKNSDSEKIINIIDSFLASTNIDSIEMSCVYLNHRGFFVKIGGIRELYIQIDNEDLFRDIMKMINNKYSRDRDNYCINSDITNAYNVILDDKTTSYSRQFIKCEDCSLVECGDNCPKHVEFKLLYKNGRIVNLDKKFIVKFITSKLWEIGKEASVLAHENDICTLNGCLVGRYVDAYFIICGDLSIRFDCKYYNEKYILNLCDEIVGKYNEEVNANNDVMKRQLKIINF